MGAEAYFELVKQDEDDARRESADKQARAEQRLHETLGSRCGSLLDALEANNNEIEKVRAGVMEEIRRLESRPDMPQTPPARTGLPGGATAATFGLDGVPGLDFDKLLAEIDAVQAETHRWMQMTPKAPRRMEKFEQDIAGN